MQKASSPKAPLWIGLLFFLELVLFLPLDAVLMFFCLQKREYTLLYIALATIASLASGLIGYLLGHYLWDLIGGYVVPHLISSCFFDRISNHLQLYENWTIFFGSLLPFPLKAISIISGVFQLGAFPFALFFASARLLRFSLLGGAMAIWGDKMKQFIERHFHRIIVVIGAKVAMVFLFFWVLAR